MSHIKAKDQRKIQKQTKSRGPRHGQKDHRIRNGRLTRGLGMVGPPTPPLLDLDQAGGTSPVLVHPHMMQCPAFQKSRVVVQGMLQATDSPNNVLLHHGNNRAQTFRHHGVRQDSQSRLIQVPLCARQEGKGRKEQVSKDKDKRRVNNSCSEEPKAVRNGRMGFRSQIHFKGLLGS